MKMFFLINIYSTDQAFSYRDVSQDQPPPWMLARFWSHSFPKRPVLLGNRPVSYLGLPHGNVAEQKPPLDRTESHSHMDV